MTGMCNNCQNFQPDPTNPNQGTCDGGINVSASGSCDKFKPNNNNSNEDQGLVLKKTRPEGGSMIYSQQPQDPTQQPGGMPPTPGDTGAPTIPPATPGGTPVDTPQVDDPNKVPAAPGGPGEAPVGSPAPSGPAPITPPEEEQPPAGGGAGTTAPPPGV